MNEREESNIHLLFAPLSLPRYLPRLARARHAFSLRSTT